MQPLHAIRLLYSLTLLDFARKQQVEPVAGYVHQRATSASPCTGGPLMASTVAVLPGW